MINQIFLRHMWIRPACTVIGLIAVVAFIGFFQTTSGQAAWNSFRAVASAWPPWTFAVFVALAPLVGFPLSPCHVLAGGVYGFSIGTLVMTTGLALNISLSHLVVARLLRAPLTAFLTHREWPIPRLGEVGQFRALFLLRTIPGPPFWLQNYLVPLSGIPFWLNFIVSFPIHAIFATGMVAATALALKVPNLLPWIFLGLAAVFVAIRSLLWFRIRHQNVK